jgi:hypothetical protein
MKVGFGVGALLVLYVAGWKGEIKSSGWLPVIVTAERLARIEDRRRSSLLLEN